MTRQRDEFHTVNDCLGTIKCPPLAGFDVWRRDRVCTLEELLRFLRRRSSDFGRQLEVAFGLRDVNIGIWKDALSVLSVHRRLRSLQPVLIEYAETIE